MQPLDGPDMNLDAALVKEGIEQWSRCQLCHGPGAVAGGSAPDLRASIIPLNSALFSLTVRTGNEVKGMPKFTELNDRELDALRHYIRYRARMATRPEGVARVVAERGVYDRRPRRSRSRRPRRSRRGRSSPPARRRRSDPHARDARMVSQCRGINAGNSCHRRIVALIVEN